MCIRHSITLNLFLALFQAAQAQVHLSNDAQISVITCGPWQGELYAAFGHSAIRVFDPELGLNEAFNYGVFDFDQPNFYLNFARGYLNYKLAVWDYPSFANVYIYENRYVHEQILNLSQKQKQQVFDFLQWNALPENQYYRYDYFYDNCATRIRDAFVNALKDSVSFDGSYLNTNYTIRELTDLYLGQQPWGDLGIDICLGLPMDKVASPYDYMFLPEYIESGFDHGYIFREGNRQPLVSQKISVYESRPEDPPSGLPRPLVVFSFVTFCILILTILDLRRGKLSLWLDGFLFGLAGTIGLLLLVLWLFTDHRAAANNFNLIWALPTHVAVVFALTGSKSWIRIYFLIVAVICGLLILSWQMLPQALNYSLIPVILALGIRAFAQYRTRTARQKSPDGSGI